MQAGRLLVRGGNLTKGEPVIDKQTGQQVAEARESTGNIMKWGKEHRNVRTIEEDPKVIALRKKLGPKDEVSASIETFLDEWDKPW